MTIPVILHSMMAALAALPQPQTTKRRLAMMAMGDGIFKIATKMATGV